jgi:hypothetical protein
MLGTPRSVILDLHPAGDNPLGSQSFELARMRTDEQVLHFIGEEHQRLLEQSVRPADQVYPRPLCLPSKVSSIAKYVRLRCQQFAKPGQRSAAAFWSASCIRPEDMEDRSAWYHAKAVTMSGEP